MDYTSLLARVSDTLGGQVTTDQAAAMVELVEARLNRIIHSPEREATVYRTVTADPSLPVDCWQVRDVWLAGSPDVTLEQVSPDAARAYFGTATGKPVAYVVTGRMLDLFPTPEATSTDQVYIRYQRTIPALSDGNTTNWLIEKHPDVYFYGVLVQSEAYIANDERVGLWKAAFDEALGELGDLSRRQRYGASPLVRKARTVA